MVRTAHPADLFGLSLLIVIQLLRLDYAVAAILVWIHAG